MPRADRLGCRLRCRARCAADGRDGSRVDRPVNRRCSRAAYGLCSRGGQSPSVVMRHPSGRRALGAYRDRKRSPPSIAESSGCSTLIATRRACRISRARTPSPSRLRRVRVPRDTARRARQRVAPPHHVPCRSRALVRAPTTPCRARAADATIDVAPLVNRHRGHRRAETTDARGLRNRRRSAPRRARTAWPAG